MSSSATTLEPAYVVDTHALIWYLLGSSLLSASALVIFRAAEMYYANQKYSWFPDFGAMYIGLKQKPYHYRIL